MSKYDRLAEYLNKLERRGEHRVPFAEIETMLGFKLPPSARTHRAWWANQAKGRHVQARAWLAAGWETKDPDLRSGEVTFIPARRRIKTAGELVRAWTMRDAKKAVALQFGVRPEDVEITIRG